MRRVVALRVLGGVVALGIFGGIIYSDPVTWRDTGTMIVMPTGSPSVRIVTGSGWFKKGGSFIPTPIQILGFGVLPLGQAAVVVMQENRISGEARFSWLALAIDSLEVE